VATIVDLITFPPVEGKVGLDDEEEEVVVVAEEDRHKEFVMNFNATERADSEILVNFSTLAGVQPVQTLVRKEGRVNSSSSSNNNNNRSGMRMQAWPSLSSI